MWLSLLPLHFWGCKVHSPFSDTLKRKATITAKVKTVFRKKYRAAVNPPANIGYSTNQTAVECFRTDSNIGVLKIGKKLSWGNGTTQSPPKLLSLDMCVFSSKRESDWRRNQISRETRESEIGPLMFNITTKPNHQIPIGWILRTRTWPVFWACSSCEQSSHVGLTHNPYRTTWCKPVQSRNWCSLPIGLYWFTSTHEVSTSIPYGNHHPRSLTENEKTWKHHDLYNFRSPTPYMDVHGISSH